LLIVEAEDTTSVTPTGETSPDPQIDKIEDNFTDDLDAISKMSEEDIILPVVEVKRVPKFRSKTQFSTRTLNLMDRPPWRP
jgi:hypothetical protein